MLFGHFAISALIHRYLRVDLPATVIGGIFPDIVDKTLCQGLHITPSGRMYGHTLLGLFTTTTAMLILFGRKKATAWGLGYLGHLLGDSGGFVPWFYPFTTYYFRPSTRSLFASFRHIFGRRRWPEWVLLIWAVWALTWGKSKSMPRN